MNPPTTGPTMPAIPQVALNRPIVLARSSSENSSPTIVRVTGNTAPAPRPWTTRQAMSWVMSWAKPQRTEP
jgi:hypothetical protein